MDKMNNNSEHIRLHQAKCCYNCQHGLKFCCLKHSDEINVACLLITKNWLEKCNELERIFKEQFDKYVNEHGGPIKSNMSDFNPNTDPRYEQLEHEISNAIVQYNGRQTKTCDNYVASEKDNVIDDKIEFIRIQLY